MLWTQCGQAGPDPALLGLVLQWETDNTEIKKQAISSHMKGNEVERVNYQEKGSGQASGRGDICAESLIKVRGSLVMLGKSIPVEGTECAQSLGGQGVGVRASSRR